MEEISRLRMENAVTAWENGIATPAAMALLAFNYSPERASKDYAKQEKNNKDPYASLPLDFLLKKVAADHRHTIENNNGVRAEDLKNLFEPVSIPISEIDASLITSLENFGSRRGKVAHVSYAARQREDPESVYKETLEIAKQLHELTLKFERLHASKQLATIAFLSSY